MTCLEKSMLKTLLGARVTFPENFRNFLRLIHVSTSKFISIYQQIISCIMLDYHEQLM
jgi:hypothetical protein